MNKFRLKSNSNSLPLPVQTGTTNALESKKRTTAQVVQCTVYNCTLQCSVVQCALAVQITADCVMQCTVAQLAGQCKTESQIKN